MPSALGAFLLISILSGIASGGGRELLSREQGVTFPVSPTTDHLGALLLTPLNVAWLVQTWALLGSMAFANGPQRSVGCPARHRALDRRRHLRGAGRGLGGRGGPQGAGRHPDRARRRRRHRPGRRLALPRRPGRRHPRRAAEHADRPRGAVGRVGELVAARLHRRGPARRDPRPRRARGGRGASRGAASPAGRAADRERDPHRPYAAGHRPAGPAPRRPGLGLAGGPDAARHRLPGLRPWAGRTGR